MADLEYLVLVQGWRLKGSSTQEDSRAKLFNTDWLRSSGFGTRIVRSRLDLLSSDIMHFDTIGLGVLMN